MVKHNTMKQFLSALTFLLAIALAGRAQTNLIVNGNFNAGNSGFQSDYVYDTDGGLGTDGDAGHYLIAKNTLNIATTWGSVGQVDHTTGNGKYMIVNGSTDATLRVWYETVNVSPNTTYDLSFWASNLSYHSLTQYPAKLKVVINGDVVVSGRTLEFNGTGNIFSGFSIIPLWENITASWNSGSSTTATIAIYDLTAQASCNDFGLDDFSFLKRFDNINFTANDDYLTTCKNNTLVWQFLVTANDTYSPSAFNYNYNVDPVSQPSHGTAYWNTTINRMVYDPETDFVGTDSFKYRFGSVDYNIWDTATVYVTVKPTPEKTTTIAACEEYTWYATGITYTQSGYYTYHKPSTGTNVCDSILNLNLTIDEPETVTVSAQGCNSYTWDVNGETYTQSGIYTYESHESGKACPTTYNLALTINKSDTTFYNVAACTSYLWGVNGVNYTGSGTFTHLTHKPNGCFHIDQLNLTIEDNYRDEEDITMCDEYYWPRKGMTYYASTIDSIQIPGPGGICDSTFVLNLTINESKEYTQEESACGSYTWINGQTYTQSVSGISHTMKTAQGCDSTVYLDLEIRKNTTSTVTATACDSYTWDMNGITYYADTYNPMSHSDVPKVIIPNAAGCDSIIYLNLTLNKSYQTPIGEIETVYACEQYQHDADHIYTDNGLKIMEYKTTAGCDSTVIINLFISQPDTVTTTVAKCESYEWNGTEYHTSGTYYHTVASTGNTATCPTVEELNLTINHATTGIDTQEACGSFTWIDGNEYTESNNTATYTLSNQYGCDSVVTLNLTVNQATTSIDAQSACDSYTWIDGITYTASNSTATYTMTNAAGCDSIITLNLTVNTSMTHDFEASACDTYTWDNTQYQTSGDFAKTYQAANGCDSIVTMHLTINESYNNEINTASCGTYTWNGVEYDTNGDYTQQFTTPAGCDSIVTMHLNINAAPEIEINGQHTPMGGSETQYSENTYSIELQDGVAYDSITWSVDCENWLIDTIGDGSEIKLYIYTHTTDTNYLTATIYNECGATTTTFWIRTTYYDIPEVSISSISILPNPNKGDMSITLENTTGDAEVKVFDLSGNIIDSFTIAGQTRNYKYDMRTNAVGVYYFRITVDGNTTTKKVVVTR